MATFWEIAAHLVDHMFSFVFRLFVILVISHFGFEGWVWVLIASVPDRCILFTFIILKQDYLANMRPLTPVCSRLSLASS